MRRFEIETPSNRTFGFLFAFIFAFCSMYFFVEVVPTLAYIFLGLALLFSLVSLVIPSALLPINKLWMQFGLLLGMIVSPVALGIVYFGLFTPIAFLMRLGGRDELRLKFKETASYWIPRNDSNKQGGFDRQY